MRCLIRSALWTFGLFFALSLEPTRCGLQPVTGQAAEIPPDYNLKLVFAEKNGPYLSGVSIALRSAKDGEILVMAINGPWFYIQLPLGTYQAKATFKGETKQIKILRVTKNKSVQQNFIWDFGENPKARPHDSLSCHDFILRTTWTRAKRFNGLNNADELIPRTETRNKESRDATRKNALSQSWAL